MLNRLTHISINIKGVHVTFDEIESMIRNLFHQVEVLDVLIRASSKYFDVDRWQRLILSHIPHLRIVHIVVILISIAF